MGERTWFESQSVLVNHPGQITRLLEEQFRVIRDWPERGLLAADGLPILARWPVGTVGRVQALMFDAHTGWMVLLEHENTAHRPDVLWPEVRLEYCLRCTAPLATATAVQLPEGAANDD
jgi:hypothetical protein